ncbi:MAG: hypothetical protein J5808_03705 [Paludibacteraceae bacterium]|nr:hypothetical protein [Paludibacteraceae bacterium]
MKKIISIAIALICSWAAFAEDAASWSSPSLKAIDFGIGIPVECYDLQAAGLNLHLGFDRSYPLNERLAVGFYLSAAGGFMGAFDQSVRYDNYHSVLQFNAGLLVEFGDLNKQPYILAVSPCTGFGLVDMDMVLPLEIRFGRMLSQHWYLTGGLTYGISLANETRYWEPAIHIGYNFGH